MVWFLSYFLCLDFFELGSWVYLRDCNYMYIESKLLKNSLNKVFWYLNEVVHCIQPFCVCVCLILDYFMISRSLIFSLLVYNMLLAESIALFIFIQCFSSLEVQTFCLFFIFPCFFLAWWFFPLTSWIYGVQL